MQFVTVKSPSPDKSPEISAELYPRTNLGHILAAEIMNLSTLILCIIPKTSTPHTVILIIWTSSVQAKFELLVTNFDHISSRDNSPELLPVDLFFVEEVAWVLDF